MLGHSYSDRRYCAACEREKAKLPTFRQVAAQRARDEGVTIIVYFDDEDRRYRLATKETATQRGYTILEYYAP
jgi:hypothetical protein